ncbi:MAG TPA: hypothetical protein VL614_09610 [Acetobacteraceae bacterium]|nr:hypothetical protein [Acetobacteraceae bacterium]
MTATNNSTPLRGSALRNIQRELTAAQDEQIKSVVTLVDNLAARGDADKLIAPLRGRLAKLRPRRKLSMSRVLFMPIDALFVASPSWSAGSPSIPRSALPPIAEQVRLGLGGSAESTNAVVAAHFDDEGIDALIEVGADIWQRAADILATTPIPADLVGASGLRASDYTALANAVSALFAHVLPFMSMVSRAKAGIDPQAEEYGAVLEGIAPSGALPLAMMIALGMKVLPRSELFVRVADAFAGRQNDPNLRAACGRAIDCVLDGIEQAPVTGADVAQVAEDVRKVAAMLADLQLCSAQQPRRRERIEATRRKVDIACRDRFCYEMKEQLLAPSADLGAASDETFASLEATARDLRRFEAAARQIGSADQYDRQLQSAAQTLCPVAGEDAMARISRIRLVEILQGSDAATEILKAAMA